MSGSSDLYLDYDMLSDTRDDIRHISDLMERPCQAMAEVNGAAMGVGRLVAKMDDFGDEWNYGIGQLSDVAQGAADALDQIISAFRNVDESLEEALGDAGSGPVVI